MQPDVSITKKKNCAVYYSPTAFGQCVIGVDSSRLKLFIWEYSIEYKYVVYSLFALEKKKSRFRVRNRGPVTELVVTLLVGTCFITWTTSQGIPNKLCENIRFIRF